MSFVVFVGFRLLFCILEHVLDARESLEVESVKFLGVFLGCFVLKQEFFVVFFVFRRVFSEILEFLCESRCGLRSQESEGEVWGGRLVSALCWVLDSGWVFGPEAVCFQS